MRLLVIARTRPTMHEPVAKTKRLDARFGRKRASVWPILITCVSNVLVHATFHPALDTTSGLLPGRVMLLSIIPNSIQPGRNSTLVFEKQNCTAVQKQSNAQLSGRAAAITVHHIQRKQASYKALQSTGCTACGQDTRSAAAVSRPALPAGCIHGGHCQGTHSERRSMALS